MSDTNKIKSDAITEAKRIIAANKADCLANEQLACSSDASLCSGAGRKAPANGPDVQGTDLRSGFAELRKRVTKEKHDAIEAIRYAKQKGWAYHEGVAAGEHRMAVRMLLWIDDLSGCEE